MRQRILLALILTLGLILPVSRALAAAEAPSHEPAAGTSHEEEKAPLLPDFTQHQVQLQALWVVLIFIVLLIVLYPTAWKGVLAGLEAREKRIRNDIAEAEKARASAEATLREYSAQLAAAEEKVRGLISQATAEGERIAAGIRTHAQQESEEIKERANRDIEAAKNQAITQVYEQTADLATRIAEKILRRNLNADDQKDLVKSSLDQLQNLSKN